MYVAASMCPPCCLLMPALVDWLCVANVKAYGNHDSHHRTAPTLPVSAPTRTAATCTLPPTTHTHTQPPQKNSTHWKGVGPRPPSSALPLGQAARTAAPLKVTPVPVTPELEQCLLAVSHAGVPDQVMSSNVAGFAWVSAVDTAAGTVTCLLPTAAPMPGEYFLAGTIKTFIN